MTFFQCVIVAGIITGVIWMVRLFMLYRDCTICIHHLTITYYLLNVKRCHVEENEDYSLEVDKRMIVNTPGAEKFVESMQKILIPTFLNYQKMGIIVPSDVNSFVPCFHKINLQEELGDLMELCGDVLERYTKLDDLTGYVLAKRFESLITLCEVMNNKRQEIDKMKEEKIYFFEKGM